MNDLQILNPTAPGAMDQLAGMLLHGNATRYRAAKNGFVQNGRKRHQTQVYNSRLGIWMNSLLLKDEWEELDAAVVRAANTRLKLVGDLVSMGLVKRLGSIGTMISQWNTASAMDAASVSMDGRSQGDADRVDYLLNSVPVPVIFKPYHFGSRELASSRNSGDAIETGHAEAAARVVIEKLETIAISGLSTLNFYGKSISGITNEANVNTGSGSDWGTIGNVITTVAAMITALETDGHYGPYKLYAARTQFNQAKNAFFTDGSGDSAYDRVLRMSGIIGFDALDGLTDGTCVLIQMDSEVIDLAFVPGFGFGSIDQMGAGPVNGVTNLEWMSGDGMATYHKVLTIAVPRVKSRYDGKSGIAYYSSI